ncbi:related to microtubule-interacting protein [Cephalotrichum gorgonifer]|uniref:Ribosome biogenesis protein YTM1 n=1 Tax=Cephalotrichum gorgonifer TaxID=2041049 RepID=A0AAE8MVV5_9PEZI|nr:related to microtubule-interacting protein [Cephalotrichum gorgonifer]
MAAIQIKVVFATQNPDIQLPEEKRQLVVPSDIKRHGLSQILNHTSMLDTSVPIPFDFLINGTFLRGSLASHLESYGISTEETVTLDYVPSLLPPFYENSFLHEDWVSDVDVSGQGPDARLLSASYDKLLRVWDRAGGMLAVSPSAADGGHRRRVNTAKFLTPSKIASSGLDGTVLVWEYSEAGGKGALKPVLELTGHSDQIRDITVHQPSNQFLTASSDGRVGLWTPSRKLAPQVEDPRPAKRAKSSVTLSARGPLSMVPVSDKPVTAAVFHPSDPSVAYASAMDGSVRTVDLTTGKIVSSLTTMHPLRCLAPLAGSSPLLAAGTTARHITLVDPRESAATTSVMTLRAHLGWVESVCASPENEYSLVSGSWDSTCKIWDLRSVRAGTKEEGGGRVCDEAVYSIPRETMKGEKVKADGGGGKVLRVKWDAGWGIVSGGEDRRVQINGVGERA